MSTEHYSRLIGIMSGIVSLILGLNAISSDTTLAVFSLGFAAILFGGVFIFNRRTKRLYNVKLLSQKIDISLEDEKGRVATRNHHSRFKALADNVLTYTDHASVDGAMDNLVICPGTIREVRKEGGDLFITWEFGRVLKTGDEVEQRFSANLTDTFLEKTEYWSVRITVPMDSLSLRVHFPAARPYKSFKGIHRVTAHETLCHIQPKEEMMNGRPTLYWELPRPEFGTVYKLVWDW